jgi:hypothetical protein
VTGKFEEENEVLLNLTSISSSALSGVVRSCCGGNWKVTMYVLHWIYSLLVAISFFTYLILFLLRILILFVVTLCLSDA